MKLKHKLGFILALMAPVWSGAHAAGDNFKIGVLNDQSGLYADITGPASVEVVKMAAEDHGGKVLGKPIVVVDADHQNKADIGSLQARKWFENENVDIVVDFANSAVALAVLEVAKQFDKTILIASAGSSMLTGKACSANSVQWVYNTEALANTAVQALTDQGAKSWYFLTVDYAFGHAFEADATKAINRLGGKVLGASRHPLGSNDLSSYLLQAQGSQADAIAIASAGGDVTTAIKQANEFGVTAGKQKLVALNMQITDTHAIGLEAAQGLLLATGFEWNVNPEAEAWSRRFEKRVGRMPTMVQAGLYSAVSNYLKAVDAAGTTESKKAIAQLRGMKIDDFFARHAYLREDGQLIHDMYVVKVKSPAESKGPWDYYEVLQVVPGEKVFATPGESKCPLLNKQS